MVAKVRIVTAGSGGPGGLGDLELAVETRRVGDAAVVVVQGDLDDFTAPQLRPVIEDRLIEGATLLVIDLAELAFLGSAGLAVLLEFRTFAIERGMKTYLVVGNNRRAARPVEVAGLSAVLPLRPHLDEVLRENDTPG